MVMTPDWDCFDEFGFSALELIEYFYGEQRAAEVRAKARSLMLQGRCRQSVSDALCRAFVQYAHHWLGEDAWDEGDDGKWYVPAYVTKAAPFVKQMEASLKASKYQKLRTEGYKKWQSAYRDLLAEGRPPRKAWGRVWKEFQAIVDGRPVSDKRFEGLPKILGQKGKRPNERVVMGRITGSSNTADDPAEVDEMAGFTKGGVGFEDLE